MDSKKEQEDSPSYPMESEGEEPPICKDCVPLTDPRFVRINTTSFPLIDPKWKFIHVTKNDGCITPDNPYWKIIHPDKKSEELAKKLFTTVTISLL